MSQQSPRRVSASLMMVVFFGVIIAMVAIVVPRLTHPSKLDGRRSIVLSVSWWDPAKRPESEAMKILVNIGGVAEPVVSQAQSPWSQIFQVLPNTEIVLTVVQKLAAEASKVPQSSMSCTISLVGSVSGGYMARNQRGPSAGSMLCETLS